MSLENYRNLFQNRKKGKSYLLGYTHKQLNEVGKELGISLNGIKENKINRILNHLFLSKEWIEHLEKMKNKRRF